MSKIFGSGEMFDTTTLGRLYPGGSAEYLAQFTQALDQAITSGFIVAADRRKSSSLPLRPTRAGNRHRGTSV